MNERTPRPAPRPRQQVSSPASRPQPVTRRAVLGAGLSAAAAAALAACSSDSSPSDPTGSSSGPTGGSGADTATTTSSTGSASTTTGASSAAKSSGAGAPGAPAHVPYSGPTPDVPGGPNGLLPGYYHYPKNPPSIASPGAGDGSTVSMLLQGNAIATPHSRNKWWQAIEKATNVKIDVNQTLSNAYRKKLTVTFAGGDIPDMVQIVNVPDLPGVLDKYFTELSPYIAGDAVKEYPALAALPPSAWTAGLLNGKYYGIAQPRSIAGLTLLTRQDMLDELKLGTPDITSGKDLLALCKAVTDSSKRRYAWAQKPNTFILRIALEMAGMPNNWSVKSGKFVSAYESDAYPNAIDAVKQMWDAGYIDPDVWVSSTAGVVQQNRTVLYAAAFESWAQFQTRYPKMNFGAIPPAKWDGGGSAPKLFGPGHYGAFIAMKKTDSARVNELLKVWNYFASPFGTKQYLDVNFGISGHDYTLNGADPELTKAGHSENIHGFEYLGTAMFEQVYVPGNRLKVVDREHDYLAKVIPTGVADPSVGLYSATQYTKGASATAKLVDLTADIIQGRKPVSEWKSGVAQWKKAAGDAIAKEYAEAYAASH